MTGPIPAVAGIGNLVLLQQQAPPLTALLGEALIFFGLSLGVWGAFGQGKVTGPSAGIISAVIGAAAFVWAVLFIFPVNTAAALVVAMFGAVFLSAGFHTYTGAELPGHGVLNFMTAGVTVIVAIHFSIQPLDQFGLLALAVWTYVLVLIGFGGGAYFGTDRWLQYFSAISYFVGIISTGLYGTLLMLGYVGFGL